LILSQFFRTGPVAAALVALLLALPVHSPARAGTLDSLDKGPAVGASLPHPLTLADQHNQPRDFAALKRKRGLILQFSRSFEW
jgi:hypothetical protein